MLDKTLKDFEKLQFQNNFNRLQKIIRRKKKSKTLYLILLTSYIYCLDYVAFDKSDCEVFLLYFF